MKEYWSNDWYRVSGHLAVAITTTEAPPRIGEIVKVNSIKRVVVGIEWGSSKGFGLAVRNEV